MTCQTVHWALVRGEKDSSLQSNLRNYSVIWEIVREVLEVPDAGWGSWRGPGGSEKMAILLSKVESISAGALVLGGQAKICAENPTESMPFPNFCLACLPKTILVWPLCLLAQPHPLPWSSKEGPCKPQHYWVLATTRGKKVGGRYKEAKFSNTGRLSCLALFRVEVMEKKQHGKAPVGERNRKEKREGSLKEMLSGSIEPLHEVWEWHTLCISFRLCGRLPFNTALICFISYYVLCYLNMTGPPQATSALCCSASLEVWSPLSYLP